MALKQTVQENLLNFLLNNLKRKQVLINYKYTLDKWQSDILDEAQTILFFYPLPFVGSAPQWPMTFNFEAFLSQIYPLHCCPILILEKEPVFPFIMLSAKQRNYWYCFYKVFGMKRSLTGEWIQDLLH